MTLQEALKSGLPYKQIGELGWRGAGVVDRVQTEFTLEEVMSDQWIVQSYEAREECKQLQERIRQLRERFIELGGL